MQRETAAVPGVAGSSESSLGEYLLYFLRLGALGFGGPIALAQSPYYRRFAQNRQVKAFVQGVTAAAVGAIAGAAYILGRRALVDLPTVLIGVITFVMLRKAKRIPEPLLILAAGIAGLLLFKGR